MKRNCFLIIVMAAALCAACGGKDPAPVVQSIATRGSLGFWFHIDADYYNGDHPQGELVTLAEVPEVISITLDTPSISAAAAAAAFAGANKQEEQSGPKPPSSIVNLDCMWLGEKGTDFFLHLDRLPGPAWYYVAYRWDSEAGIFDGFLNGVPLRMPGAKLAPWVIAPQTVDFTLHPSVEDFELSGEFWSDGHIMEQLSKHEYPDMTARIGYVDPMPMDDVEHLKGELIFAPDFSKRGVTNSWRMEGPGVVRFEDGGWMHMESSEIDVGGPGDGHFVFWTPEVLPSDFIAEWEFQPLTDDGLCIVLFSAAGMNGENVFNPSLKERNGNFAGYIRGDINCYHISYFANAPTNRGRTTSNMRKNHGFYLVANGPIGVPAGSRDVHVVTLIKEGGHVRLGVDGKSIIDWIDDGVQYGPVLGNGQIALRQMKWMKARYRNFKVWAVK